MAKKKEIKNSKIKKNANDYRKFVAKNVKLTSYDKLLLGYINGVING